MDGVLEATLTLCGCKVLCSVLCLPAFKDSISSVSLCCSCLLLFTDLSITVFLAYLWSAAPRPVFFHPSSDVIALRFMLFLGHTYGVVLMMTPLLVAVEVLVRLLCPQEDTMPNNAENKLNDSCPTVLVMDIDGEALEIEPLDKKEGQRKGILLKFLKAMGFLGCLLLWSMSGTYAGSSWRQDQSLVSECLDGGGSLSACLPCLLTGSSPIRGQHSWVLAAIMLLLGLTGDLGSFSAKLAQIPLLGFRRNHHRVFRDEGSVFSLHLGAHRETEVNRMRENRKEKRTSLALLLMKMLWDHSATAASKRVNSCIDQSSQFAYNDKQWHLGNSVPLSGQTGLTECCKLQSKGILLVSQLQIELPLKGIKAEESTGHNLNSHEMWLWEPQRESPGLRGELMTGLVCGLLVCVFPTVLSTNVLLVSNLEMLVVYFLKHLLIQRHSQ